MAQTLGQAFAQLFDGNGLVAGRLEVGDEPEVGHLDLASAWNSSISLPEVIARTFYRIGPADEP
jgi:hypothetical protein